MSSLARPQRAPPTAFQNPHQHPPPSQQQQQQQQQPGGNPIRRMASAREVVGTGSYASPLARLEAEGRSARSRAGSASTAVPSSSSSTTPNPSSSPSTSASPPKTDPPPIPALEFNLFRHNSVLSIDSLASDYTITSQTSDEDDSGPSGGAGFGQLYGVQGSNGVASVGAGVGALALEAEGDGGEDSPSTPKATAFSKPGATYFESGRSTPTTTGDRSRLQSSSTSSTDPMLPNSSSVTTLTQHSGAGAGALTPKRSFTVSSRPVAAQPPPVAQQPSRGQAKPQFSSPPFQLGPVPPRRNPRPSLDTHTRDAPAALHPEETAVEADWASVHGEQGSDWGDDESNYEWLDTDGAPQAVNGVEGKGGAGRGVPGVRGLSPSKRLSKLKAAMGGGDGPKKLRKPLVIPKRAPPPPPPVSSSAPVSMYREGSSGSSKGAMPPSSPTKGMGMSGMWRMTKQASHPTMKEGAGAGPQRAGTVREGRPNLASRWTDRPGRSSSPQGDSTAPAQPVLLHPPPPGRRAPSPLMVPLKGDSPTSAPSPLNGNGTRQSHMSFQSGYSFYDLDGGSSPSTPRADGAEGSELAFPKGKYTKVSSSVLDRERELRERAVSEPGRSPRTPTMSISGRSAEDLVHMGIEARGKGDLPKSAYYFMKAAEAGSSTGRMYWGLALRHGWGVGRDDKRSFVELRQACDESLAEGGLAFHTSPGHTRLTHAQKKSMTEDLALGMFEVGNCFLDGVGVKKAPDVALQYLKYAANLGDLAAQEQLGFILSKGSNGVKKDMKEAAKWYRMAITQGSSNTFGLAWVWKETGRMPSLDTYGGGGVGGGRLGDGQYV
ncbi:hypothetical protein IAT38_002453 [Cryptococcus sp. DSM 104549]